MATKSANVYARIEPDVKEQAEGILAALGIPASNAINMFYKQIILQRGLPFEVKMPSARPVDVRHYQKQRTECRTRERICGYAGCIPDQQNLFLLISARITIYDL